MMFYIKTIVNYFVVVILSHFAANTVWSESASDGNAAQLPDTPPSIVLHIHSVPGEIEAGLEIENISASTVLLDWRLYVEQRKAGKWSLLHLYPGLVIDESCSEQKTTPCFELATKSTFKPSPWTGFSCSYQCSYTCRANAYLGQGTFRYVLHSCDKSQKFYSPPFSLTADGYKYWLEKPGIGTMRMLPKL